MSSEQSPILRISVPCLTPRLQYTFDTVLHDFLGIPHTLLTDSPTCDLTYGPVASTDSPRLPCDGTLFATGFEQTTSVHTAHPQDITAQDLLARIFRRLSQYDDYTHPQCDTHQRYITHPPSLELHADLSLLRTALLQHFPWLQPKPQTFTWEITIDIDQPWKYRHKPPHVMVGGLVRDLLSGHFKATAARLRTHLGAPDPFDTLSEVTNICPPEKTTAFILAGRSHPLDSRFSLYMPGYQDYVRRWQAAGIRIGIHPSYLSSDQPDLITTEKVLLEKVTGPVTASRQHYLRYRLPSTFRTLLAAGIQQDYTLCGHEALGSRTGIALPYNWYDLQAEAATPLRLIPAVVMDRTLQQYLKLKPTAAFGQTCALIDTLRSYGGHFVLILHNETFSDSGEWAGWLQWIKATVAYLRGDGNKTFTR